MTSSEISTDRASPNVDTGFRPWQFYVLLSMVGATVAVMLARDTHPAALLLLSAAVLSAGLVGLAVHRALGGFLSAGREIQPVAVGLREREVLEREKALTLRSIKELDFDHAMGKVSAEDYAEIGARLRARAMSLIEQLEAQAAPAIAVRPEGRARSAGKPARTERPAACRACGTRNDADAKFCKNCGGSLAGRGAA